MDRATKNNILRSIGEGFTNEYVANRHQVDAATVARLRDYFHQGLDWATVPPPTEVRCAACCQILPDPDNAPPRAKPKQLILELRGADGRDRHYGSVYQTAYDDGTLHYIAELAGWIGKVFPTLEQAKAEIADNIKDARFDRRR